MSMPEEARRTRTQRTADRLMDHIMSKGFETCPICGGRSFEVGSEGRLEHAEELDLSRASRILPVMCVGCGYVMLFGTGVSTDRER